ncbi:MAG: peptide MFS transporter [Acidobacteria bacterium]|nr:peptide MFS transporter [Acidobacteriota bacterium]
MTNTADRAFFGHPKGLSTLFFTEMWERFSYYGMRALLILYMTGSAASGGLGFDVATAGAIYGLYTSSVYLMSLPGGWIADKVTGSRLAVLIGGIIIASGHFLMAVPSLTTFYVGLAVIVIGTGLLKPNVSAVVGMLYQAGDTRRDAGFSIFYMGINTGAFIAPLACGYVGQRINWHWGFGLAGIGMTLGVVQYVLGWKHLGDAGALAKRDPANVTKLWRAAALAAVVGTSAYLAAGQVTAVDVANVFGLALMGVVVLVFGGMLLAKGWTPEERKRVVVITVLFLAASLFWATFEQAGSTLNLFADRNTDNNIMGWSVPASFYQSVNAMFLILLAPPLVWLWMTLGSRNPSVPVKFVVGLVGAGLGFVSVALGAGLNPGGGASPWWLIATYFFHTVGELCLSPVGLSAMTKLAPARVAGLMMGCWFLSNSVGNYLGGRMAGFYQALPLDQLFGAVAAFAIAAGVILLSFRGAIVRLMGGVR